VTRLRGGTSGILAAIASGRLDPLSAFMPEERHLPPMTGSERRALARRESRRAKKVARWTPF